MFLTVWHIGCRYAAVCYNYEAITIITCYPKQIRVLVLLELEVCIFQNTWAYVGLAYTLLLCYNLLHLWLNHMSKQQWQKNVCTAVRGRRCETLWKWLSEYVEKESSSFPCLLKVNLIWQDQKLICRIYIIAYCSTGNTLVL